MNYATSNFLYDTSNICVNRCINFVSSFLVNLYAAASALCMAIFSELKTDTKSTFMTYM